MGTHFSRLTFKFLLLLSSVAVEIAFPILSFLSNFFNFAGNIRWYLLGNIAKRRLNWGFNTSARNYAEELLSKAKGNEKDWYYGDAIHKGHIVLGLIALRQGDMTTAKLQLQLAGQSPGSPALGSFGPNMLLAKELLEAGEVEVVMEYFVLCEKFWDPGFSRLQFWASEVRNGNTPNFGPNLRY